MVRTSSRLRELPLKVRECMPSPEKSHKKTQSNGIANDKVFFDYDTVAVCNCTTALMALVHFCGFPDDCDEWRPAASLPDVVNRHSGEMDCSRITAPLCPARLKVVKSRRVTRSCGPPVECPLATQFLKNMVVSPLTKQKRPNPPVPIFPPSPPSAPPSPPPSPPFPPFSPPSPPPLPFRLSQSTPVRVDRGSVIYADPVLSLAIANSLRDTLPPREPFVRVPDMCDFIQTLTDNINLTMSHSFGRGFWNSDDAATWKLIREEVVLSLEAALHNPTELAIFQACSDLLLAPGRLLSFLGFVPPDPMDKPKRNPDDIAVKLASDAVSRGESGKALRILTGNGAAPHTEEQLLRTSSLFPLPVRVVTYTPTDDVVLIDPLGITKMFRQLVSSPEPASPDVFGWDPTLFRDVDGSRFTSVVTRFLYAYVGWSHAPPICAQLFASSKVISIFKLPEAERALLPDDKKMGIRPIGGQCLFGKMIDRQVLDTDDGRKFKASVSPIQQAFNSRGVISIPTAALGALNSGYAIAKGDVSNAYQEICRQAALDNLKKVSPALANYFSRALLQSIPLFTKDVDGFVVVIWSATGAPQGSVSGNIVYTAGVSKIYEILQLEYPKFFLLAATDDLTQFLKPEVDTPEAWQDQYVLLSKFLHRYTQLAWDMCSLRQNLSKSAIILPLNAPHPLPEVLDLFPEGFKFHHVSNASQQGVAFPNRTDGMVICGAPVGSAFYINEFVKWKMNAAIQKIQAIGNFGRSDIIPTPKHAAFKLLASSGTKLLSYVGAAVPPQYTVSHFKKFDNVVRNTFLGLLYPDSVLAITERIERSYHRATLSIAKGGLGLLKASVSAASSWWTNLRALQTSPTLYPFLQGLEVYVPDAIDNISKDVGGGDSVAWLNLAPHFLVEVDGQAPDPPPKGQLKEFLLACSNYQHLLVKDKFAPENAAQYGPLTKSDVISYHSRSNLNIVFNDKRIKNLSNDQFVKLTTVFLGLPPTQDRGNAENVEGFDYPVEFCMVAHGKNNTAFLDANADHHSGSCPSAAASVYQRHTNLTTVLIKFAVEAGATYLREPSSHKLFQGHLSAGQCAKLFPKKTPKGYKEQAKVIVDLLSQATVDKAKIADLTSKLTPLDPANSASLRLDLALFNPSNQKAFLIDGSFIHTSCPGYRDGEFKDLSKRLESAAQAAKMKSTEPLRWEPSLTIAGKAKKKVDHYAPVMQILKFLERDNRVAENHSFVPFIVSSLGELSREAFCLMEEIIAMYRHRVTLCEEVAFPLLPNQAVADFRYRFKLAVMRVAAVGLANIACTGGLPSGNRALHAVY